MNRHRVNDALVYAWIDFQSTAAVQTPEAIEGIKMVAAVVPCLYFALSIPCLMAYRLTEKVLKETGWA